MHAMRGIPMPLVPLRFLTFLLLCVCRDCGHIDHPGRAQCLAICPPTAGEMGATDSPVCGGSPPEEHGGVGGAACKCSGAWASLLLSPQDAQAAGNRDSKADDAAERGLHLPVGGVLYRQFPSPGRGGDLPESLGDSHRQLLHDVVGRQPNGGAGDGGVASLRVTVRLRGCSKSS